jgi:hypothetical protein
MPNAMNENSEIVLPHKLSEKLRHLLTSHGDRDVSVADLIAAMGKSSFGLLTVILSLPSALPIPAPGYSTPFGILLMVIGFQLIAGRSSPWLPQWAMKLKIKRAFADKMLAAAAKFFGKVEHLIKPRVPWMLSRSGQFFAGAIIVAMGALMAIPIPGTNTAPAMVIFLTGVALTERDGMLLIATSLLGCLATVFYAVVLWIIFYYGAEGVGGAKDILKKWFGK